MFGVFWFLPTGVPLLQAGMSNYKYVKAKENVYIIKLYEKRDIRKKLEHRSSE